MPNFAGIVPATRGLIAAPWTPASLSLFPVKKRVRIRRATLRSGPRGPRIDEINRFAASPMASRRTLLRLEAIGPLAAPFDVAFLEGEHAHSVTGDDDAAPLAAYYFNFRKTSIYGGSNEIQKNIIAQMMLGL